MFYFIKIEDIETQKCWKSTQFCMGMLRIKSSERNKNFLNWKYELKKVRR